MNKTEAIYDNFSSTYDETYDNPKAHKEDEQVKAMLRDMGELGDIVDIGCGTGILLDLLRGISERGVKSYHGFDPSGKMLDKLTPKIPAVMGELPCLVDKETMEGHYREFGVADGDKTYISLYGSISYVDPAVVMDFFKDFEGKAMLMFYTDNYHPTYFSNGNADGEIDKSIKLYRASDCGFENIIRLSTFDVVLINP